MTCHVFRLVLSCSRNSLNSVANKSRIVSCPTETFCVDQRKAIIQTTKSKGFGHNLETGRERGKRCSAKCECKPITTTTTTTLRNSEREKASHRCNSWMRFGPIWRRCNKLLAKWNQPQHPPVVVLHPPWHLQQQQHPPTRLLLRKQPHRNHEADLMGTDPSSNMPLINSFGHPWTA